VSRDRRFRRREGKPTCGLVYGWDGSEIINEAEAERVREMGERILAGERATDIARDFTHRGIPRKRQGKLVRMDGTLLVGETAGWGAGAIRTCLTTPRNYGLIRMPEDGTMKVGDFQGIFPPEQYAQMLHVLEGRGNRQTRPRRMTMLTGLISCADCKLKMVRNTSSSGRSVLACKKTASDLSPRACGGNSIPVDVVEAFVTEWVWAEVDGAQLADFLVEQPTVDVAGITAELQRIEVTLEKAADQTMLPPDDDNHLMIIDYKRMCRSAEKRREELTEQLSRMTSHSVLAPFAGQAGALRERWEQPTTTMDWKRNIIAEVLEREGIRIEVTPGGRRNRANDEADLLRIHVVSARS
jgi:hypothetical protein